MKYKFILAIPFVWAYFLLFSGNAFAASNSDIAMTVTSPIDSLQNESGMVAVEQFPAEISIRVTAQTGALTDLQLEYNGQSRKITPEYILTVENKDACGSYTITAKTDQGAVLTITVNVIFQVKAIYDTRYRTIGMNVKEIYEGETLLKSFSEPQRLDLVNANTVADYEQERIAGWIGRYDGKTYTLKGSNVVEIYGFNSGKLYGTYDTNTDFGPLITGYGWTPQVLIAFETMRNTALSYQAPVKIDVTATWSDEKKQEVYGRLTAQDKGVPELLYPYQTTFVTFTKDDILLSHNFIYMGLEWNYTPESAEYTDGESKTQTAVTQKIHYRIPTAAFYFKFKAQDGNDLSVAIRAPATVKRGDNYSFAVIYLNSGKSAAYDVALKGTVDGASIEEIPAAQDFLSNESKTYVIKRTAATAADEIRLWANIGVPEGFIDGNLSNNTATAVIKVIDPEPEPAPDNPDTPDNPDDPDSPDDPVNPPEEPPVLPEPCDLSASILAPPTVYEREEYSFTVYFANSSDKELSDVGLNITINGKAVPTVPSTANFKAFEKKAFLVTATAGEKGVPIRLSAQVSPPSGYRDINTGNNQASAEIMVLERPYDLDVQRITPDRYKENQSVITTVKVSNKGSLDFTPGQNVTVLFQIPKLSLSKRIDAVVMEKDTWNVVSLRWDTPNMQADKNITLVAIINPEQSLKNETTADNNTYTQKAMIQNVSYEEPEESRALPDPPPRNEQPRVTWWEQRYENGQFVWRQFYAELKVSAVLDYDTKAKGYLKSGYGYSIRVTATVDTNYDRPELITAPQTAEVYLPEYRYETAIPLVKEGGQFTFKENPASPFRYRKQYIPVWFPDNRDYIVQLLVTDVHTPGGTLSKWITGGELKIHVVDSMYSDDVTTGN